jgi:hypothetical protein
MALDEIDHRLFVVTRAPARLAVLDTKSGHVVATLPCVQNSDDVYYDSARKRIYVPGGEGYISVFQQKDPDHYELIARIPSAVGPHRRIFRKGEERFRGPLPGCSGSCRSRRRGADLHCTGLIRK